MARCKIFIDTETTGLRPEYHEIIEIYIIKEDPEGKILGEFHYKVTPEFIERASNAALKINGYTVKKWEESKPFTSIAAEVKDIVNGCIWIGHNPKFDYDFLQEALFRAGIPGIRCSLIDTKVLAHEHLIDLGSTSFDNIRDYLGWSKKDAHTAKTDTIQLRRFYYLTLRMSTFIRIYLYTKHRLCRWIKI
jgi:DNA polymerase III alpha subunit (gram-positive type)